MYPPKRQKDDFESRFCNQTQWLYTIETFDMSQMIPKKYFPKTAYSLTQFNYHTGHSL